jgi:hypothetical protein
VKSKKYFSPRLANGEMPRKNLRGKEMKLDKAIALAKDFFKQNGFTYNFQIAFRSQTYWLELELEKWEASGRVLYHVEFKASGPESVRNALLNWIKDVFGIEIGETDG